MDTEQAINQLISLKMHCKAFKDKGESESIWDADVEALEIAITALKKDLTAGQPIKSKLKNIFSMIIPRKEIKKQDDENK